MTDSHRRAATAERAARAGGAVARQAFRGELDVETKADKRDLVTETDRDAQRQAVATVRSEFPGDAIVAEEEALPVDDDERLADGLPERGDAWVIDPIDGTANFARGLVLWATSVAAVVDGEPAGSATYLPALAEVYAAGPGGATRDGTPLSVSGRTDPETFAVGLVGRWGPEEAGAFGDACAALTANLGNVQRFGSMQATLAFVADGGLDAVVATAEQAPWDTLAGVDLVQSAGGRVTDPDGERWEHDSAGLVASNGEAHGAVVDAVRTALDG